MESSQKNIELLTRLTQYTSDEAKQELIAGEDQVLRALDELCGDVEPYQPSWDAAVDDCLSVLMLVGPSPRAILDLTVSGTAEEPTIKLELMPTRDSPVGVRVTDRWASGEQGSRAREQRWTFTWETEPARVREIVYYVTPRDDPVDAETALAGPLRGSSPS
jgi:hypothetical protein